MRTIFNYGRGENAYRRIAKSITRVESFYDFPETMAVYGESLRTSHLMSVNDNVFFRRLNKNIQLLGWYCDNAELHNVLEMLKRLGYKIGSRGYLYDAVGLVTKPYEAEYYADQDWSLEGVIASQTARQRKKMRTIIKHCSKFYALDDNVTQTEAIQLHGEWVEEAKSRHFMVLKGCTLRWIDRHYEFGNNTHLFGIRRDDGCIRGLVGYEVFGSDAQLMMLKHRNEIDYFSRYVWAVTLQTILSRPGVARVMCGNSVDELKSQMRLKSAMSYKVVI